MSHPVIRCLPALAALALAALAGCKGPMCEMADGTRVRHAYDRNNCGLTCGFPCAIPGLLHAHTRCVDHDYSWICVPTGDAICQPGYHDLTDAPGCECVGPSPADCTPCGDVDLPHTGIDEDCDLRIDEVVPNTERSPRPPNGPKGAVRPGVDWRPSLLPEIGDRNHCGEGEATCALPAGAVDVRCVPRSGANDCAPVLAVGEQVQPLARGEANCLDGIDDDGNGVIDDGPTCQTLIPAVRAPESHGRTPGPDCPPTYVPLDPSEVRLRGSVKPLVAKMTYDVLLDNHEATLGQVQRFLVDAGRCDRPEGQRHPLCDVTGDPALPAGGLDWCVAYEYCQSQGKRMLTELEWLRAFGGTSGTPVSGEGCSESGQTPECGADGPRTVDQLGGHAAKGIDGEALIYDAIGNIAEWLYDAQRDPCEAPWADCSRSPPRAMGIPHDPVAHAPPGDWRRPRLLRGGGWSSELGAASIERRQFADPGVEIGHYGVRCAQTFRPVPASLPGLIPIEEVPYEWTLGVESHARCIALPQADRLAPRTRPHRLSQAVDTCLWGSEDAGLAEFVEEGLAGQTPMLFSVTDEGGGAATMKLETGLVPGAEAFWLTERPPTPTLVREGCTPFGCAFALSAEDRAGVTVQRQLGGLARLPLRGMKPLFGAMPTCLPPVPFVDTAWRMDFLVPSSVLSDIFIDPDSERIACKVLQCDQDIPADSCAESCTAWRLSVDVHLHTLTGP